MKKDNQWKVTAIIFIILTILLFGSHLWRDNFNPYFPTTENIPELKQIAPDGYGGKCFSRWQNSGSYVCYIYPNKIINGTVIVGASDFLYEYLCFNKYNCFYWRTWKRIG